MHDILGQSTLNYTTILGRLYNIYDHGKCMYTIGDFETFQSNHFTRILTFCTFSN
jgi:hypothetical protein